jgi:hypothetical protein
MAFDPDTHEIHPPRHARNPPPYRLHGRPPHRRARRLAPDPATLSHPHRLPEVGHTPHASHIHRHDTNGDAPLHVSVPLFPSYHVGRDGVVTVLVDDEEYEKYALAEKGSVEQPARDEPDMGHPGFVHHPASAGYPWGWWGPSDAMESTAMAPVTEAEDAKHAEPIPLAPVPAPWEARDGAIAPAPRHDGDPA